MSANISGRRATLETAGRARRATALPRRPAWVEIDLGRLRRNFQIIQDHTPPGVGLLAVVKDEAYGHGSAAVARVAADCGVGFLATATLQEAAQLRQDGLRLPILLFGERLSEEVPACLELDLHCAVNRLETVRELNRWARKLDRPARVHLKIDTGMSRYGVRWTDAPALLEQILAMDHVKVEGVFSHFAMSDEEDKSFAWLQWNRFQQVLDWIQTRGVRVRYRHLCNSGGFLDLPEAHFDMVRLGILPLGVYPSKVCRRLPGIAPVMSVKCRLAALQSVQPGDTIGYGMRYRASKPSRIGVLPLGYGDGFPRLRNQGWVLLRGNRADIVGANAMDAIMVDLSDHPEAAVGDEIVILGRQQSEEISVHDVAAWGQTVSYDILSGWRGRLPRVYVESAA